MRNLSLFLSNIYILMLIYLSIYIYIIDLPIQSSISSLLFKLKKDKINKNDLALNINK